MKLNNCYIENFGTISKQKYVFDSGMNCFYNENGTGKTTLTIFIKSMLYGISGANMSKSTHIKNSERKAYYPWNQGKFGGYLEFELNKENYRVTRWFGKKESEDAIEVVSLKTGKAVKDYEKDLGEKIFGVSVSVFEKTVFNSQFETDRDNNSSITKELNNFLETVSDQINFQKSDETLSKKINEITSKTGLLKNLKTSLHETTQKLEEYNADKENAEKLLNIYKEKDKQLSVLLDNQKELLSIKELRNNKKLYDLNKQSEDTISSLKAKIVEYEKVLNSRILTQQEYLNFIECINKYDEILEKVKTENLKLSQIISDDKYIAFKKSGVEKTDVDKFINSTKTEEENSNNSKFLTTKNLIILLASVMFFVLGIFMVYTNLVVSIIGIIIGFSLVLILIYKKLKSVIASSAIKGSQNSNLFDKANLPNKIKEYLVLTNTYENFKTNNIFDFVTDYNTHQLSEKMVDDINNSLNDLNDNLEKNKFEIDKYIKIYEIDNDDIKNQITKIREVSISYEESLRRLKEENNKLIGFDNDKYLNQPKIEVDLSMYDNIEAMLIELGDKISDYKNEMSRLNAEINSLSNKLEDYPLVASQQLQISQDIIDTEYKKEVLETTKKYLHKAKDEITSIYLKPMLQTITTTFKDISAKSETFSLDADFNLAVERDGENKESAYFSKGYQELFKILIRASLFDKVFKTARPFIVLDDSFVNVDDKKMDNISNFVKELSKKYQIFYFTCHTSRIIK